MDNLGGAPLRKESVDFSINPLLGHYRKLLKIGQSVRFSLRALKCLCSEHLRAKRENNRGNRA
jgi:hypothetical protein